MWLNYATESRKSGRHVWCATQWFWSMRDYMQVQTSHMYCRQRNQSQTNEFMVVVPSAIKMYNTSSRNDERTFCNFLNVFIVHKNSENPTICFPNYVFPFIVSINFLLLLCVSALPLQQWSNSSGADSHVGYFPTHRTIVIIHRPERPDYHLTVGLLQDGSGKTINAARLKMQWHCMEPILLSEASKNAPEIGLFLAVHRQLQPAVSEVCLLNTPTNCVTHLLGH